MELAALALEPWQLDDTLAVDGRGHQVSLTRRGPKVSARETGIAVDAAVLARRVTDELLNAGVAPRLTTDVLDLLQQLQETLGYAR